MSGSEDNEAVRGRLEQAAAALATHTEPEGVCDGCLIWWTRLAPFPCDQRRWALALRAADSAVEHRAGVA